MRDMQHDVSKVLGALNLERLLAGGGGGGDVAGLKIDRSKVERILKAVGGDATWRAPLPDGVRHMYS